MPVLVAVIVAASGCGSTPSPVGNEGAQQSTDAARSTAEDSDRRDRAADESNAPGAARTGAPAASERIRFKPTRMELSDGSVAPVEPAATVDGELEVPENIDELGWWDGGAYVNDPFGSTVIAGHIDSAEQGVGFFGSLLTMQVGDEVTVRGGGGALSYEVISTELVDKDVLASDTVAFDQSGDHRLVLITCSGRWRPEVHSYESNYVVVAEPIGLAEPTS